MFNIKNEWKKGCKNETYMLRIIYGEEERQMCARKFKYTGFFFVLGWGAQLKRVSELMVEVASTRVKSDFHCPIDFFDSN